MATGGQFMIDARDRLAGTDHPQERVMKSAAYLAEHLAEVPAIVIPTIIGLHDGSGRPGLFDSVIQSVWSFSVALRARGLGSSWTTAILGKREELADLLGVPAGNTQIAMIPVAWTKGTEFHRAPRLPARSITFLDRYGHTWESGPSDPPCLADGPGTVVEVDVKAPVEAVWDAVTDINVGAEYSDEFQGARWADGATGPSMGAEFVGTNTHPAIGEWEVSCFVNRFEVGVEFGWVTSDDRRPGRTLVFRTVIDRRRHASAVLADPRPRPVRRQRRDCVDARSGAEDPPPQSRRASGKHAASRRRHCRRRALRPRTVTLGLPPIAPVPPRGRHDRSASSPVRVMEA